MAHRKPVMRRMTMLPIGMLAVLLSVGWTLPGQATAEVSQEPGMRGAAPQADPGPLLETVFSLPVGPGNLIEYRNPGTESAGGPNELGVLSDGTFLISDWLKILIYHLDSQGNLLETIDPSTQGVQALFDMQIYRDVIYLLDDLQPSYYVYRVLRLTAAGMLLDTQMIPEGAIDQYGRPLTQSITGIAVDCNGRIVLSLISDTYHLALSEIVAKPNPIYRNLGFLCQGKYYRHPQAVPTHLTIGGATYRTPASDPNATPQGGPALSFIAVRSDGAAYVRRIESRRQGEDFLRDATVHLILPNGRVGGVGRLPGWQEYAYDVPHLGAIGPDGEFYLLIPRADRLEVARLIFYPELPPLAPQLVAPSIYLDQARLHLPRVTAP